MSDLDILISHRFRGFTAFENTLAGLDAALEFGVRHVEFDIRVTRCGTPVIYHDEFARDAVGRKHVIAHLMLNEFEALGGTFAQIPTAESLFKTASAHSNSDARLLVDIKDLGFEVEINALVHFHKLQERVVYVSWLPEVLYRLHDLAPDIPKCLSHWCADPDDNIRKWHHVSAAPDGIIARLTTPYIHGDRRGWFVQGGLKGEMLALLRQSQGSVCVPENMLTRDLSDYYHGNNIAVSAFSFTDWAAIRSHQERFQTDLFFIDNKTVFEMAAQSVSGSG